MLLPKGKSYVRILNTSNEPNLATYYTFSYGVINGPHSVLNVVPD